MGWMRELLIEFALANHTMKTFLAVIRFLSNPKCTRNMSTTIGFILLMKLVIHFFESFNTMRYEDEAMRALGIPRGNISN